MAARGREESGPGSKLHRGHVAKAEAEVPGGRPGGGSGAHATAFAKG